MPVASEGPYVPDKKDTLDDLWKVTKFETSPKVGDLMYRDLRILMKHD